MGKILLSLNVLCRKRLMVAMPNQANSGYQVGGGALRSRRTLPNNIVVARIIIKPLFKKIDVLGEFS